VPIGALSPAASLLDVTPTQPAPAVVTTSIYRLAPSGRLIAYTDYTVTVQAGLEDTTGGVLAAPYTYTFRTADPAVIQWQLARAIPREGSDNVKIEAPITVTFSMPMDQASTEAAPTVDAGGRTPMEPLAVSSVGTPTVQLTFCQRARWARHTLLRKRRRSACRRMVKYCAWQAARITTVFHLDPSHAPSNGGARAPTMAASVTVCQPSGSASLVSAR
jgi:hypothetical protein